MVFWAVELARARAANVLIICKASWLEITYIVVRYNKNLSAENLNCLRWLLDRGREHNQILSRTSDICPLSTPTTPYV